jgi:uncharacterized protein YciI
MTKPFVLALCAAAIAVLTAPSALADRAKPPAEAKVAIAKGRLFAAVLGPGPKWKKGQPFKGPGLDQHRAYWKKLHDEGRVASAGPLGDDTGLILLRAKNQSEASALVAADPAVKAQILRGVARPYRSELTSAEVLAGR